MIRIFLLFVFAVFGSSSVVAQGYSPNEVLVQFNPGASQAEIYNFLKNLSADILDVAPLSGTYLLDTPYELSKIIDIDQNGFDPTTASGNMAIIDNIVSNEPIYIEPFSSFTTLNLAAEDYNPILLCNEYPYSIQSTYGNRVVKVAIIDTGVNPHSQVVNTALSTTWSYQPNRSLSKPSNNNNSAIDEIGHGTSVAGIIAASFYANNSQALDLRSYKVIGDMGFGTLFSVTKGIEQAIIDGAEIINLSLGYLPSSDNQYGGIFEKVMDLAGAYNVLFICSAGNDGMNLDFSSYYPSTLNPAGNHISVGATDCNGVLASWSNFSSEYVDVLAPGTDILFPTKSGGWSFGSGTSYSTPIVTTIAAALSTQHSSWNADDVYCELTQLTVTESNTQYGIIDTALPFANCGTIQPSNSSSNKNIVVRSNEKAGVYPNPFDNYFSVSIGVKENLRYQILLANKLGQIVCRWEGLTDSNKSIRCDIANSISLPSSLYYIIIDVEGEESSSQKIIKM